MITVWFNTFKWCQSITFLVTLAMYSWFEKTTLCCSSNIIISLYFSNNTYVFNRVVERWYSCSASMAKYSWLFILLFHFHGLLYISQKSSVKDYSCMWILCLPAKCVLGAERQWALRPHNDCKPMKWPKHTELQWPWLQECIASFSSKHIFKQTIIRIFHPKHTYYDDTDCMLFSILCSWNNCR